MPQTWRFSTSDNILFGCGAAGQIGAEAAGRGYKRALIITDANLIGAGVVDPVSAALRAAGLAIEVFADGQPEPSDLTVEAAAARAESVRPDVIIGLGGGSNMDVAKVAAIIARHGGQCGDYFGEGNVPGPGLPVFAVPTTAGTGSEVTAVAVIEDSVKGLKLAVASAHIRPQLALVDPLLTLSCPAGVTAESGMDALAHAVETRTVLSHRALHVPEGSRQQFSGRSLLTDALAERAIQLVGAHLRNAVFQPRNLEAREGMHLAALLAGMAFSSAGLGAVHALQYPLGAQTHTSHGLGTGLLLPYVVEFLLPSDPAGFAHIAALLGAADGDCVRAIQSLKSDIGIPLRLSDLRVREDQLHEMAQQAAGYARLTRMSARPLTVASLEGILKRAL